jgi:hypothetical protein
MLAGVVALGVGCAGGGHPHAGLFGPADAAATGQVSPVTGFGARERTTVTITSTDARGVRWRSVTRLTADASGRSEFDAGTLIAAMKPLDPAPAGAYFWGAGNQAFRVPAGGASIAVFRRLAQYPVHVEPVHTDGLVGTFYNPAVAGRHSAVLVIGGSEGGLPGPHYPYALAGEGHPVLALAYFKAQGLPSVMAELAHDTFSHALQSCSNRDHFVGRGIPDEPYARHDDQMRSDEQVYASFFAATLELLGH